MCIRLKTRPLPQSDPRIHEFAGIEISGECVCMLPERPFLAIVVHSHTQETGIVYRNKTSVRGRNRLCRDMLGPLPVRIGVSSIWAGILLPVI